MPQLSLFGTILSGVAAVIGGLAEAKGRETLVSWTKVIIAANALLIPIAFLFPKIQVATLDNLYAVAAWTVAAAIFVPDLLAKKFRENGSDKSQSKTQSMLNPRWRQLALVWAAFGAAIWLAASYAQNQPVAFHVGLVINIGWLLLFKFWFRLPTILIQIVNTVLLLSIGFRWLTFFFVHQIDWIIGLKPENATIHMMQRKKSRSVQPLVEILQRTVGSIAEKHFDP